LIKDQRAAIMMDKINLKKETTEIIERINVETTLVLINLKENQTIDHSKEETIEKEASIKEVNSSVVTVITLKGEIENLIESQILIISSTINSKEEVKMINLIEEIGNLIESQILIISSTVNSKGEVKMIFLIEEIGNMIESLILKISSAVNMIKMPA